MRVALSDRFARSAQSGEYYDATCKGLSLRVTPQGARTFFLTFTSPSKSALASSSAAILPSRSRSPAPARSNTRA